MFTSEKERFIHGIMILNTLTIKDIVTYILQINLSFIYHISINFKGISYYYHVQFTTPFDYLYNKLVHDSKVYHFHEHRYINGRVNNVYTKIECDRSEYLMAYVNDKDRLCLS